MLAATCVQVVAHVEVAEQRLGTSEGADRVVGILGFHQINENALQIIVETLYFAKHS